MMHPLLTGGEGIMLSGLPVGQPSVVHLSVNTDYAWRDISVLSRGISIKLATDIHHVSVHCWKMFSRSAVKGQSLTYNGAVAYLF